MQLARGLPAAGWCVRERVWVRVRTLKQVWGTRSRFRRAETGPAETTPTDRATCPVNISGPPCDRLRRRDATETLVAVGTDSRRERDQQLQPQVRYLLHGNLLRGFCLSCLSIRDVWTPWRLTDTRRCAVCETRNCVKKREKLSKKKASKTFLLSRPVPRVHVRIAGGNHLYIEALSLSHESCVRHGQK